MPTTATAAGPVDEALPLGFRITLDPSARQLADDIWIGGSPTRVVRLTAAGRRAMTHLRSHPVSAPTTGLLARRLTDAGLAHPVPARTERGLPIDLTVVVPVFERARELGRCLTALGTQYPVVVVDGSADAAAVAQVAAAHDATLLRREVNAGPAAARNTGLTAVRSEFVAFVDSDCEPAGRWLDALVAHLADGRVGAVAPRITAPSIAPASAPDSWATRYATARGSLDLGAAPARVAPNTRVSYVPTAILLARRAALLGIACNGAVFDESLRVGEDVDLVWRLDAAGWRVRYEPGVRVTHHEPRTWPQLLARRHRYGTSAAPLGRRHPGATAPLVLYPWPTLAVAGLLARRPVLAALGYLGAALSMRRTLRRAGAPGTELLRTTLSAVYRTWLGIGRYGTQFAAPVLAAATLTSGRRGRRLAAASLLFGPPLTEWWASRPALDPIRFVGGAVADEIAYGSGVLAGCCSEHTTTPIRPTVRRLGAPIEQRRSSSR